MPVNPVINAQMNAYAKSVAIEHQSPETQFEVYSIFAVLNGHLGESIEPYDVHLIGDEFGVDGIAITVQGELVRNREEAAEKLNQINNPVIEFMFFQSKTGTSYDYGDMSKFFDAIVGFFTDDLRGESEQVDDLMSAKDEIYSSSVGKRNPSIKAFYIATGNYEYPSKNERLRERTASDLEEMNIFEPGSVEIQVVGAKELQKWYRAATTSVEVEIEFSKNVVMPNNPNVEEAYIEYLSADQLVKLYAVQDADGGGHRD